MPIENTSLTMLSGVRRGDDSAWKRFYDTYKVLVFMRGKALGFSPADIDDLLMKVMERFFSQQGKFTYDPAKGRFRDFFSRIVRNLAYDMLRARRRQPATVSIDAPENPIDIPDKSSEEAARHEWQSRIYAKAFDLVRAEMPPRAVQCWTACRVQGTNARDVARFHGVSLATVYNDCQAVWEQLKLRVRQLTEEEDF